MFSTPFFTRLCIAVFICLSANAAWSQTDTEFWFVAPEVTNLHGDRPIVLRVAAGNRPANVTIVQPADPTFTPITQSVPANTVRSIPLTGRINQIENRPANQILTKGLYITSDEPVTAYYEIANGFNPEIFPLKGRNALGTDFFTPSQNLFRNEVGDGGFDIVATEDATQVTITPTTDMVGHPAGVPFTIMLNRGETFSCRAIDTSAPSHYGGSRIVSNKPIAVTICDDSLFSNGAYDVVGDQLVPTGLIGTEYIAVRGLGATERVFIVATENNTVVHVNGNATPVATLAEGQLFSMNIIGASLYLESSAPIYAYHLSGHGDEIGDAVLPPIACTGSDAVSFIRPGSDPFSMMILTEAGNENSFTLNGGAFTANFTPVPGNPNWVSARIDPNTAVVPANVNTLANSAGLFHLGILYNYDGFSSEYGYFSNYSTLNIGDDRTICSGRSVRLDAGESNTNYAWNTGDSTRFIWVNTSDTFIVTVDYYNCTLSDTMILQVNEVSVDLGPDRTMCAGSDTLFTAVTPNTQVTYEWQDGSTATTFQALDTGMITVTLTDTIGCTASDTALFAYHPVIQLGSDTSFVCDSINFVITTNGLAAQYTWQDGSTDTTFLATSDGVYHITAIDSFACVSSDTLFVAFVNSPVLDLGPDTLICPEAAVTFDAVIPGGVGYLWQDSVTTARYTTSEPGTYIVRVVDSTTCFTWDTIQVTDFVVIDSFLIADTLLCDDAIHVLEPSTAARTYQWQDGSTAPSYIVQSAGTYALTITDFNGCLASDTTFVEYLNTPNSWPYPPDTTVCHRTPVVLVAYDSTATAYEWEGPSVYYGQNDYTDSAFIALFEGEYAVTISNYCGATTHTLTLLNEDCTCTPFVPNAFSPNGDGENEEFRIYTSCFTTDIRLRIYDRKGSLLVEITDIAAGWDGTYRGQKLPTGVYLWTLDYQAEDRQGRLVPQRLVGDVTLLR